MRLFFIRHEERPDNPAFKTQLTESGQFRAATSIKDKLSKLGITTIFSSPFIRVLQTIQPFVLESGVKVKIDFGVSEGLNSSVFVPSDTFSTPDIECNIDASHISYYDEEFYYAPENEMDINQRVKIFLDVLLKRYGNTNETILIATHKCVCNILIRLISKEIRHIDAPFDMGQISYLDNNELKIID